MTKRIIQVFASILIICNIIVQLLFLVAIQSSFSPTSQGFYRDHARELFHFFACLSLFCCLVVMKSKLKGMGMRLCFLLIATVMFIVPLYFAWKETF
jgi:hypothetical protein